jgi:hypothetical protein
MYAAGGRFFKAKHKTEDNVSISYDDGGRDHFIFDRRSAAAACDDRLVYVF